MIPSASVSCSSTAAAAQPVADRGELLVGELEQPGGEREPAVEVAGVLLGNGALVADVVLELRPRVLQHGAHLDLRERAAVLRVGDLEVPAGVAEPALARGLLAEVAVVEHGQLAAEHVGDRGDVAAHVGDHPDADLVGDRRAAGRRRRARPSTVRAAFAANDSTLLARPMTLR